MPAITDADLDLCAQVKRLGRTVSGREVRTLREYGALVTVGDGKGGRGRVAPYTPGSARVVAAIATAKADPTYRRKLWRAVLIAWRRGAAVGTEGLRQAFYDYYEAELRTARNLVDGKRVEGEPEVDLPPGLYRAIAAAQLGYTRAATDVGAFEAKSGPIVRAAFWRSGQRDLLPAVGDGMGFATKREDGSWSVSALGDAFWEALALAPLQRIARSASRDELEAALPLAVAQPTAHGFRFSDLVIATNVPRQIQWMRKWYGERWWQRLDPPGSNT